MLFLTPTNTCFGLGCFIDNIKDYQDIYKLKGRDYKKPCAIFLDSLESLKNVSNITYEQINFLKKYKKPWTILINIEKIKNKYIIDIIHKLPNSEQYKKIGFRIAHTKEQKNLIEKYNFFFLTSANKSGEKETKSLKMIKNIFKNEIEQGKINIVESSISNDSKYYFSDVFEFLDDSIQIKYFRKNI